MGQPEMQPEGPPQDGRGEGAAGLRPGDLTGRPFPLGDWAEPAQRLDELYRWVERGALDTAAWYLADRVWKRRGARALRTGAATGAVAGASLPLLDLTGVTDGVALWGIWRCMCSPSPAWPPTGSSGSPRGG
ncbi:SMODS and SLOG-associating 2TM effector domain-containing protein OS=Streptomyces glaucescens OX=1907 GN=SGLAU_18290 PE=4 SV=1 [Streptomyces glaucescens]